ncbi:MAG: sugar nucleotide-binding protein [Spirochaetes bacterium]|nr:sugar nucleotide-binding protein [Spirochaetota bacterium]MBN2772505.1 sugar nucleotide-binding protein [Spirochaetota bacterium]
MILLSGENRTVAHYLLPRLRDIHQVCSFGPDKGDINNDSFLNNIFRDIAPTVFVNLEQVDDSDDAEVYREWAYNSNSFAPRKIAGICSKHDIFLVHISTTDVYPSDDKKVFDENDTTDTVSVFSDSKLLGEKYIRESGCRYAILRLPRVYGINDNFLEPFFKSAFENRTIRIIKDQKLMPIYAGDVASAILSIIDEQIEGIYNFAGSDQVTMYQFLFRAFDIYNEVKKTNISPDVQEVPYEDYLSHADQLLANLVNSALFVEKTGINTVSYEDGLKMFAKDLHYE